MATRIQLITSAEADAILVPTSIYTEWDSLTDTAVKDYHIMRASDHVRNKWYCPDVDWEDSSTLTDDTKEAIAKYANASLLGHLYPFDSTLDANQGPLKEETVVTGSVRRTQKWDTESPVGSQHGAYLRSIDEILLGQSCSILSFAGSGDLIRV
jgi:hypothetical protein